MKIKVDGEDVGRLDEWLKGLGDDVYEENYSSLDDVLEGEKKGYEFDAFILVDGVPEQFKIEKGE